MASLGSAYGREEASSLREYSTLDMARRMGTITPDRLFLNGFPVRNPVAAFNPGLVVDGGVARVYPRIIVGYYKYVSAIVEAAIPLDDILGGEVSLNTYSSSLAVTPSTRYDLWGAEDPRVYRLGENLYMTYTGRTIGYFDAGGLDRTLPITARLGDGGWVKVLVHRPPGWLGAPVSNDKNAFMVEGPGGLYLFHRPQLVDGRHLLLVSRLPGVGGGGGLEEVRPVESWVVMDPAGFEVKIGWGPPPVRLPSGELLFLLHGVGRELQAYRVFAALLELGADGPVVRAVTRRYVMGPRESYEVYGDRPYTVFPCGAALAGDGLLVSYGAGDYVVGFSYISLDELLGELDRGRVY